MLLLLGGTALSTDANAGRYDGGRQSTGPNRGVHHERTAPSRRDQDRRPSSELMGEFQVATSSGSAHQGANSQHNGDRQGNRGGGSGGGWNRFGGWGSDPDHRFGRGGTPVHERGNQSDCCGGEGRDSGREGDGMTGGDMGY
jgi:hypothetical protein